MAKPGLDKDLKKIGKLQAAAISQGQSLIPLGMGFLFLIGVLVFTSMRYGDFSVGYVIAIAAAIGGYMALNIGANDVANNVGPAVGANALTMVGALLIAAVFESAGALLAGGNVVSTISKGIIDPNMIANSSVFIAAMIAALLAAAVWLNLATWIGAPVSTTHSIVGGVVGAGIAAAGPDIVNWFTMGKIVASWVISPLMGGLIAAGLYQIVRVLIYQRDNKIAAAVRWVPVLVALMTAAFSAYLMMKGFKKIWKPSGNFVMLVSISLLLIVPFAVRPLTRRAANGLDNRRKHVTTLFNIPLIVSAALLSFAHGANDVANAIGPLAAIVSVAGGDAVGSKVSVPLWVMAIGGIGISLGLMLYGPKLIRVVGKQLTRLDQTRAFCIALAAAITVIIASILGLPVSSTHIAVGGIFGVGFLREMLANKPIRENPGAPLKKREKKRRLVRRQQLLTIAAAWIVTVPSAALLSGVIFFIISRWL